MKLYNQKEGGGFLSQGLPVARSKVFKSSKTKKKLLMYSDFCGASTGFGTVSKHIAAALQKTGKYDIHQLAINYFGDFYNRDEYPYLIVPAKLQNPNDPYGREMFTNTLKKENYDYVFIVNDTFVVSGVAENIKPLKDAKASVKYPVFKLVYYYPIDCHLLPQHAGMIKAADRSVAYTYFGQTETKKTLGYDSPYPTDIIYHGTDVEHFFPMPEAKRKEQRRAIFRDLVNDDTFIIVNVNRNSPRKDIAKTILAYKKFKEKVPNSLLYLHMLSRDVGAGSGWMVDLDVVINELGLKIGRDVCFPLNFSPAKGLPVELLNILYNTGDVYITTHLGGGWELPICEAFACGVPVIAPNNTTTPELLGANGDRGYIYPCKELCLVDGSGLRPVGHLDDIVASLFEAYKDWQDDRAGISSKRKEIINRAYAFTQTYSWKNIGEKWVKLFEELETQEPAKEQLSKGEVL